MLVGAVFDRRRACPEGALGAGYIPSIDMYMEIDQTRNQELPGTIEFPLPRGKLPDFRDTPIFHPKIRDIGSCSGTIDDRYISKDHRDHTFLFLILPYRQLTSIRAYTQTLPKPTVRECFLLILPGGKRFHSFGLPVVFICGILDGFLRFFPVQRTDRSSFPKETTPEQIAISSL
jgi:hypothetical protein